jgi:sugar phosphate isomerase/epimerase
MIPVLSTRLFGLVPRARDLAVAAQLGFLDVALWLDGLSRQPPAETARLAATLRGLGMRVPCVHLPVRGPEGLLDLDAPAAVMRADALERFTSAMELAGIVGARVAVVHVRGVASDMLEHLLEAAREHRLALAFEADTLPGSSLEGLEKMFAQLGSLGRGHGLCVDVARTRVTPEQLGALGTRLVWLELSDSDPASAHRPPRDDDERLRAIAQSSPLPALCYEVVAVGPANVPPGEAQLTMLLRRLAAWHTGAGRPLYQGSPPSLPMG